MLNWKKPSSNFRNNEQGNFPEVVMEVIGHRCKERRDLPTKLSIRELNTLLDVLARAQDTKAKGRTMHQIFERTTAR